MNLSIGKEFTKKHMDVQKKKKWNIKKTVLLGGTILVAITTGIMVNANQKPVEDENVKFREYVVTRGDIIAGVDGGGKLYLEQEEYKFEEDVSSVDIHVKEGQMVKKEDSLVTIADTWIKKKQEELNENLAKAENVFNEKKKEKELKKKTDQKTWSDTANVSQQQYEINRQEIQGTVDRINEAIAQKEGKITELEGQIQALSQIEPIDTPSIDGLQQQIGQLRTEVETMKVELHNAQQSLEQIGVKRENEVAKENGDKDLANQVNKLEYEKMDHAMETLSDDVKKAKEALSKHQQLVENPVIKAQSDGVVLQVYQINGESEQKAGENEGSGSNEVMIPKGTSIVAIGNTSKKQIKVPVSQDEIAKLKVGQKVKIEFTAFEDRQYAGEIVELNLKPVEQGDEICYMAIVNLDETADLLLEGMSAYVEFILKEKTDVIMLSNKAIMMKEGKQYVNIKQEDGTYKEIEVKTGFSDGKDSEITEGLKENDIVVVEG